jgi:hypothetical protein
MGGEASIMVSEGMFSIKAERSLRHEVAALFTCKVAVAASGLPAHGSKKLPSN